MNSIFKLLDPYRWLVAGLLVAGAVSAFAWYRYSLIQEGHAKAIAEVQAAENAALLERNNEIARLIGVTRNWSEINESYLAQIDTLRSARAADAGRLQRAAAERRAAVAAASDVPALRAYATTAGDVYEACRKRHRGLGFEADECSAAAHTLKGWTDEVTAPKPQAPLSRLGSMFTTTPEK